MQRALPVLVLVQFALIAVLFYMLFSPRDSSGTTPSGTDEITTGTDSLGGLYVVNMDSLRANYTYYTDTEAALKEQAQQFQVRLQQRQQALGTELEQFQRDVAKVQQNPALQTNAEVARLQAKEQELVQKRQNLEAYAQRGEKQLAEQSVEKSNDINRRIQQYLASLNVDGRFNVVLAQGAEGGVLYSYPGLDITQEVIAGLNAEYAAQTKPAKGTE